MGPVYIDIAGKSCRVEANWNAISAFLKSVNRDTFENFGEIASLRPSDIAPMMAATINEGERLDGRDTHFTPEEIGALCPMTTVAEFIRIYTAQLNPQDSSQDEATKKE